MPHGFGQVMKGTGEITSYVGNQLGSMIGSAYNSGMYHISKFSDNQVQGMRTKQDKIANPHMYEQVPFTDRSANNWIKQKYNLGKHYGKDQLKGWAFGSLLSGGMYGLSAYMTDNSDNDLSDRGVNIAKHGIAAGVDIAADAGLSAVAAGLATFGGVPGMIAGGALTAFNMFAGFAGYDAGSLAMNAMNYTEEKYNEAKTGPKFNMTQNTSMAMQRQIQNLHAAGSNLGEMMHN